MSRYGTLHVPYHIAHPIDFRPSESVIWRHQTQTNRKPTQCLIAGLNPLTKPCIMCYIVLCAALYHGTRKAKIDRGVLSLQASPRGVNGHQMAVASPLDGCCVVVLRPAVLVQHQVVGVGTGDSRKLVTMINLLKFI